MAQEVVVNESTIQFLLTNPRARDMFPFMGRFARMLEPQSTSCCGRKARTGLNYRAIKLSLFGMSDIEAGKLKGLLGTDKLVFFFPGPKGTERLIR